MRHIITSGVDTTYLEGSVDICEFKREFASQHAAREFVENDFDLNSEEMDRLFRVGQVVWYSAYNTTNWVRYKILEANNA